MANGKQLSDHNWNLFSLWMAGKNDNDLCQLVFRGILSRKEIAIECAFSKSVLDQNPRIKAALKELEDKLREKGLLPPLLARAADAETPQLMRDSDSAKHSATVDRLRRVELENACLKAEIRALKLQLTRFTNLQHALDLTGRLLR